MNACKAPALTKEGSECSQIVQWPDQHPHSYLLRQDLELKAFSLQPSHIPAGCVRLLLSYASFCFLSLLQPAAIWGLYSNTLFM